MEEKEINKIVKPKSKPSVILFFMYLIIAFLCIGFGFYKGFELRENPQNFSELVSNGIGQEGKYAQLDISNLPKLLATNPDGNNHLYFVTDEDNHTYIARLSNKTMDHIKSISDEETEQLSSLYPLKGFVYTIDEQIKGLALHTYCKVFNEDGLTSDNFSDYLGEIYIDQNKTPVSDNMVSLYKILGLIGILFLVLAFGYLLPNIIKVRKVLQNTEVAEELKSELEHMTDAPYKKYQLYLTKNYVISGIEAVKYEDIIWGYVEVQSRYLIKTGRELIIYTKDKKRHTIVSVTPKNHLPDDILMELYHKNPNIKMGYNEENKRFFKNYNI